MFAFSPLLRLAATDGAGDGAGGEDKCPEKCANNCLDFGWGDKVMADNCGGGNGRGGGGGGTSVTNSGWRRDVTTRMIVVNETLMW